MGGTRWLVWLAGIALLALVGVYAYQAGVAHGIAQSGALAAAGAQGAGGRAFYWYARPWGFGGFPFFPVFPLLFILFWVFVFRGLFWHRRYPGYWYGPESRRGGVPPMFDEWHRRAHAEESGAPEHKA
jgi:hypothetical protein